MDSAAGYQQLLEEAVEVAAPPERVWATLVDLRRMSRWSPQVAKVLVRTPGPARVGSRTLNINRKGLLVWTTHSEVVELDAPRRLAFRVRENRTVWSFTLAEAGGRTLLTQRRETPDGIHPRALALEERYMGGVAAFEETLRAGMRQTLAAIRRDVER